MSQVTGLGTIWNLPNYAGELFTADATQTPLLSMAGGLTGGRMTENFEFPTAVLFDYPTPEQPEISEQASATAPAATHIAREQETNVVQIHQEVIDLTYVKQSNSGRMSGLNTAGQQANSGDEKAWQIQHRLVKIARDVEHTFLQGSYQKATAANVAGKTRGMLELCDNGTTIDAAGGTLTRAILQQLYREMANNGAFFNNMVMFAPAYLKQVVTDIYASLPGVNLPATRNVGGVNINQVETDFFNMGIVWSRFMSADTILVADVAHIAPVFQAVPGKGVLFEEELAKIGASDRLQIFGQLGLAHGPAFLHASITGLATQDVPTGGAGVQGTSAALTPQSSQSALMAATNEVLIALANEHGINLDGATNKEQRVELIRAAGAQ